MITILYELKFHKNGVNKTIDNNVKIDSISSFWSMIASSIILLYRGEGDLIQVKIKNVEEVVEEEFYFVLYKDILDDEKKFVVNLYRKRDNKFIENWFFDKKIKGIKFCKEKIFDEPKKYKNLVIRRRTDDLIVTFKDL